MIESEYRHPIDPSMAVLIPLRLKHRNPNCRLMRREGIDPPGGTLVFNGGKYKARSSNAGSKDKAVRSLRPRQRAWGPW